MSYTNFRQLQVPTCSMCVCVKGVQGYGIQMTHVPDAWDALADLINKLKQLGVLRVSLAKKECEAEKTNHHTYLTQKWGSYL